ncbi:hypothetical protein ACFL4W_03170, partial [Planctomycetota bacterium]
EENTVFELSLSRDGKLFAYTAGEMDVKNQNIGFSRLTVGQLDGKNPPAVMEHFSSAFFDWHDEKTIAFAHAYTSHCPQCHHGDSIDSIGAVSIQVVGDGEGGIVPDLESLSGRMSVEFGSFHISSDYTDLAVIPICQWIPIRCLPNGNLLFGAFEEGLPKIPRAREILLHEENPFPDLTLFELNPKKKTLKKLISHSKAKPVGDIRSIEPSPDGKNVVITSDNGKISLLSLKTGKQRFLGQGPFEEDGPDRPFPRIRPTWLSTGELCFAVPPGSKDGSKERAEIVLWDPAKDKIRCISKKWDEEAVIGLLTD